MPAAGVHPAQDAMRLPRLGGFLSGGLSVVSGLRRILSDRELTRLAVTPLVLTTLLYVAAAALAIVFAGDLLSLLWARPEEGGARWLWYMAIPALILSLFIALGLLFSTVAEVVGGPFYDRMAARILSDYAIATQPATFVDGPLADLLRSLSFLVVAFVCWSLGLLPVVGIPFALLGALVAWIGLASSAINPALVVTGVRARQRIAYVFRSAFAMAGIGAVVGVSLLVPLLGLVSIPSAVVGASELYARRLSGR